MEKAAGDYVMMGPEELQSYFKSKRDLFNMLQVDRKFICK